MWNFGRYNYRVKPEPHYRPFKNADEVLEAIKEHGNWLKDKENIYQSLRSFYYSGDSGFFFTHTRGHVSHEQMMAEYTFIDGTPFGKLIEE